MPMSPFRAYRGTNADRAPSTPLPPALAAMPRPVVLALSSSRRSVLPLLAHLSPSRNHHQQPAASHTRPRSRLASFHLQPSSSAISPQSRHNAAARAPMPSRHQPPALSHAQPPSSPASPNHPASPAASLGTLLAAASSTPMPSRRPPSRRGAGQKVLPATGPPQGHAAASAARERPVPLVPPHSEKPHAQVPLQPSAVRHRAPERGHPPPPHSRPHTTTSAPAPPHTSSPTATRQLTTDPTDCRTVSSQISDSMSHTRTSQ